MNCLWSIFEKKSTKIVRFAPHSFFAYAANQQKKVLNFLKLKHLILSPLCPFKKNQCWIIINSAIQDETNSFLNCQFQFTFSDFFRAIFKIRNIPEFISILVFYSTRVLLGVLKNKMYSISFFNCQSLESNSFGIKLWGAKWTLFPKKIFKNRLPYLIWKQIDNRFEYWNQVENKLKNWKRFENEFINWKWFWKMKMISKN
jgi:hypothetical protein